MTLPKAAELNLDDGVRLLDVALISMEMLTEIIRNRQNYDPMSVVLASDTLRKIHLALRKTS